LGLGLVVLAVAAWAALSLAFPPARLRALVGAQLQSALSRDVRYADARIGLLPPVRLTVVRPELAEPGGFAEGAAFRAASLHLDLDAWALLWGRIAVRRLVLDQPELHLVLRPDGTTNLEGIGKQAAERPSAKPMDLEIRDLVIRRGRMLVDDLKADRRVAFAIDSRLGFSSVSGGARIATSGRTELTGLARGRLGARRLSDLDRSLARLVWRLEHRGRFDGARKRLALERLSLDLGGARIAMVGIVDDPGPRARLDLRARGSGVELSQIMGFLAAAETRALSGIQASGKIDFDLGIRSRMGPGHLPDLMGTLRVSDGAFRYAGAPAGVEALGFTAHLAPDSLLIPDLAARVTSPGGGSATPVRARLAVLRFADPLVAFALKGEANLAAIGPLVAPPGTRLEGRAALDLRGRGRAKDPGAIALDGRARLAGVTVESKELPRKIERLQGRLAFSTTRAAVEALQAHAGRSSFRFDGTVTRPLALLARPGSVAPATVDFRLVSPYLDLAELLPTTPGAPLLPNATGGGRVEIARLKNQRLDVSRVSARVLLEPGRVTVPEFRLDGYGGIVTGSAGFDVRDAGRPAVTVKARADSIQGDALLSAWTPARDLLRGALKANLDLSLEGSTPEEIKRSLSAAGLALFSNGQLGPGPALEAIAAITRVPQLSRLRFKDLRLPFHVERGRVVTDPVELHGPYGNWKMSGAVGFDGSLDYAVSVGLPREILQGLDARSSIAAGALLDPGGNLLIDLKLGGTAKSPRVAWDSRAMRDRLAGRASQALEEKRRKLEDELKAAATARQQALADSARAAAERAKRALADSLRRKAGEVLKGFFGGAQDTTPK
jgi:hypothetical protein